MKLFLVLNIVLSVVTRNTVHALSSEEEAGVTETCCQYGEMIPLVSPGKGCSIAGIPEEIEPHQTELCTTVAQKCCEQQLLKEEECNNGIKFSSVQQCLAPQSEIGKICCDECSFGRLAGESQGTVGCGELDVEFLSPTSSLRKKAYRQCCLEIVQELENTTERKKETTTEQKEKCKANSCDHNCSDIDGKVVCLCKEGYRLQPDKKSCEDINECAESTDNLCTEEDTVCHNTEGSYKCVPIKKRDIGLSCPPGFKRNVINQVCDDINECRLVRPPCPKYLCENTIGGYTCAGKPGKPYMEDGIEPTTETAASSTPTERNDICPPGFRGGPDDECLDIDECEEQLDDCQHLSQYCINTYGSYFCQDHVSRRCAPGFKVNADSGICEDIDECEQSAEVCKRNEVCINQPGAYNCKSKISTLPKLARRTCQEGTRIRPGGTICEDIDECREGTHLCDQFQNCINTFGGHECRCKNGFELDSTSGSCVDIDECALKLDNCELGQSCLNVLGSFTCTRATTTPAPAYEYEYYDSEEDNSVNPSSEIPSSTTLRLTSTTTTPLPTTIIITPKPSQPPSRFPYMPRTTPRRPIFTRPTITPSTTTLIVEEYPKETPKEVSMPIPEVVDVIEKEREPDGSFVFNTNDIPKNRWTNVIDREHWRLNRNFFHCFTGFERNERGECADIDECQSKRHSCSSLESCINTQGSYKCDCIGGFVRDSSGWCGVLTTTTPKPTTTPRPTTTPKPTRPIPRTTTPKPTPRTTTTRPTSTTTRITNRPRGYLTPNKCELGYIYSHIPRKCVDIDECQTNRHSCSSLESCINTQGSYRCDCIAGFVRDSSGWCEVLTTPTPRTTTTPKPTTTPRPTRPIPRTTTPKPTPRTTTARPILTTIRITNRPRVSLTPNKCELGYIYNHNYRQCIDVDECATEQANCGATEDCVNTEGGYRCECGARCLGGRPTSTYFHRETAPSISPDSNVITVGAQYGQRGPRYLRPTHSRLHDSGAVATTCPWGYKLTPDRVCVDVDECGSNISECGPQQRCENFYGGYSCQCPSGHWSTDKNCDDIDECGYGNTCSANARCINTIGSYRCECSEGFRNAPSNDKVCVDIDECAEPVPICEQACVNAWGGYRCYCNRGYRLNNDNRTCTDVDECAELGSHACTGQCLNTVGSFRCTCPDGYRLADDKRSCLDIDECENGQAQCHGVGEVCQNTRGSYHCHQINCPSGYRLDGTHRCSRIQRSCPVSDWTCLQQPSTYSYNFITFVSNLYLPLGSVDLFSMQGPAWHDAVVNFEMRLLDVQAPRGVKPADISCFTMRPTNNVCVVSVQCSLQGPQVAELELTMSLYQRSMFAGSAVARLVVIVSEYEY